MFGFSLSKLLALVGILVAVWVIFRWIGRLTAAPRPEGAPRPRQRQAGGPRKTVAVEDLVACGTCGAYVPAVGARGCGRAGCPYPG
ncbi:MAG: hypothetical protein IT561_22055 [Alphaproteobacteria bacterium]|nr:hypothetical protein [Alphaproteobacteria bacterium]